MIWQIQYRKSVTLFDDEGKSEAIEEKMHTLFPNAVIEVFTDEVQAFMGRRMIASAVPSAEVDDIELCTELHETDVPPPKIHGWKKAKHQPYPGKDRMVIDCPLYDMETTRDVFWSKNKNSYVLVELEEENRWKSCPDMMERFYFLDGPSGKWFELASINGAGEIRWTVMKDRLERNLEDEKEDWYKQATIEHQTDEWCDAGEYLAAARHFGLIPPKK